MIDKLITDFLFMLNLILIINGSNKKNNILDSTDLGKNSLNQQSSFTNLSVKLFHV